MDIGNVNQLNTRIHHVAAVVGLIALLSALAFGCDDTSTPTPPPGTGGSTEGASGTTSADNISTQPANNGGTGATLAANGGTIAKAGAGGAAGGATAGSAATQASAGNGASGADGQSNVKVCVGKTASEYACNKAVLHKCDGKDGSTNPLLCKKGKNGQTGEELCKLAVESGSGQCAVCEPEEYQCTGQKLEKCQEDGQWKEEETCGAKEICSAANKTCGQCAKGEYQCDGEGNLNICSEDQSEYELANDGECGSPALCDVKNKKCLECDPAKPLICDEEDDEGKTLVNCSADGKKTTTACPGKCLDGKCVACIEDDDCEGSTECRPITCNTSNHTCAASSTLLSTGTACEGGVCNATGSCVECNIDSDCGGPTKKCTIGIGTCGERPPIEIIGTSSMYSVTVHPNYSLETAWTNTLTATNVTARKDLARCSECLGGTVPAGKSAATVITYTQSGTFCTTLALPNRSSYDLKFASTGGACDVTLRISASPSK